MSGIVHHLVSRGIDVTQQHYQQRTQEKTVHEISVWAIMVLAATVLLYFGAMFAIRYTYGSVVATLTMIESPTATAFRVDSTESSDPLLSDFKTDSKTSPAIDPDLFLVKQKPITRKIRTTMKHLREQAGRWSRFRGFAAAMVYHFLHQTLFRLFLNIGPKAPIWQPFAAIMTTVLLCRLQMTWTHIVISAPSSKPWYKRLPSVQAGKNIIVPTAVWALAEQITIYTPSALYSEFYASAYVKGVFQGDAFSIDKPEPHINRIAVVLVQLFLVLLVGLTTALLVYIPANVTLKRVQASMLPDEDEAIVPFDRTFGGKVTPEVVGGKGCVSMQDAWKTFDWAAANHLVTLYVKVFAIQVATTIAFGMVLFGEMKLMLGAGNDLEAFVNKVALR